MELLHRVTNITRVIGVSGATIVHVDRAEGFRQLCVTNRGLSYNKLPLYEKFGLPCCDDYLYESVVYRLAEDCIGDPERFLVKLIRFYLTVSLGQGAVLAGFATGSRFILDPPVMDTDEDHVLLIASDTNLMNVHSILIGHGWECGGSITLNDGSFVSYKFKHHNLILTKSPEFFHAFKKADSAARETTEDLTNKKDRVAFFEKHRKVSV